MPSMSVNRFETVYLFGSLPRKRSIAQNLQTVCQFLASLRSACNTLLIPYIDKNLFHPFGTNHHQRTNPYAPTAKERSIPKDVGNGGKLPFVRRSFRRSEAKLIVSKWTAGRGQHEKLLSYDVLYRGHWRRQFVHTSYAEQSNAQYFSPSGVGMFCFFFCRWFFRCLRLSMICFFRFRGSWAKLVDRATRCWSGTRWLICSCFVITKRDLLCQVSLWFRNDFIFLWILSWCDTGVVDAGSEIGVWVFFVYMSGWLFWCFLVSVWLLRLQIQIDVS